MFPAADSTPRRMRQSTSHKVKQLVAMFNIEEDSLHQDVVRVTSLPNMVNYIHQWSKCVCACVSACVYIGISCHIAID